MAPSSLDPALDALLAERFAWYHTIDLGDGRTTPGVYDLRGLADAPGFPERLDGMHAVDLGTFDGFWAFELERHGARVVAVDIDEVPPPDTPVIHRERLAAQAEGLRTGQGFALVARHLGSRVERVVCNVYDLTPEVVGGRPDLVFCGALLQHLRDPLGALEAVRRTIATDGRLILFESYREPRGPARRRPTAEYLAHRGWTIWMPTRACLRRWLTSAGFSEVTEIGTRRYVDGHGGKHRLVAIHASP